MHLVPAFPRDILLTYRQLLQRLSDKEIHLLRTVPITFLGPNSQARGGAKPTITGSDSDPIVNLFDLGLFGNDERLSPQLGLQLSACMPHVCYILSVAHIPAVVACTLFSVTLACVLCTRVLLLI